MTTSPPQLNRPHMVVIAGPNGAGKSTAAPALLHGTLGVAEFVNADVIARGLSAFRPEKAAIQAGRIMLARLAELATQRIDFAFETTLATRSFAPWIRQLLAGGYAFNLVFLWLPSADMAVARVAERVRAGGHHISEEIVRRRYLAGLRNFFSLYRPLADEWRVYNNSGVVPLLIARGHRTQEQQIDCPDLWQAVQRSPADE